MKKFLIFSILFFSFLFIDNVSAETLPSSFTGTYNYGNTVTNYSYEDHVITFQTDIGNTSYNSVSYNISSDFFTIYWYDTTFWILEFNQNPIYFLSTGSSSYFYPTNSTSTNYYYTVTTYAISNRLLQTTSNTRTQLSNEGCSGYCINISKLSSWNQLKSTVDLKNSSDTILFSANLNADLVTVNLSTDFGNNTYGFYQNYLNVHGSTLTGAVDTISITCEEDKRFLNGYCNMDYNDLINHNSSITHYNNFGVGFAQLFGRNSGYLINDNYYLYGFRLIKPFSPELGNIFINTLTNDPYQVTNILNVYKYDGGSYIDYIVKFKIENSSFTSSSNLKDIRVEFRDGLGTYYDPIPSSFVFGVYRSFKLQLFTTEPTSDDVQNFLSTNDLSSIDAVSDNYSFFTDTDFDTFGFGGIITAPFRFLYAIEDYENCSPISFTFPHSNSNVNLYCVRDSIPSSLNPLITILQIVLSGIVCYRIAVGVLKTIKDLSSPEDCSIEVVDL